MTEITAVQAGEGSIDVGSIVVFYDVFTDMLIFRVIFMMVFKQWQSFPQEKCDTYNVTTYTLDDFRPVEGQSHGGG